MESGEMLRANFEQLRQRYYDGTHAPWAAELLEDFSIYQSAEERFRYRGLPDLVTILEEGEGRKSQPRKAIDDLLDYYSIIEIAALAGGMPERLPPRFEKSALAALSNWDLYNYCERHSRFLPLLLKAWLSGTSQFSSEQGSYRESMHAFSAFLDINAVLENDPEVEMFLRYLSGEEWGGYDLNDLVSLTRRPAELMSRLTKSPDEEGSNGLDIGLHGFRSFLIFAHRLDSLLRSCSDDLILRSAFWHFHSKVFYHLAQEIRTCMERVLNNLGAWTETAKAAVILGEPSFGPSPEESLESLEEFRWTIWRLTSDLYERPLLNALGYERFSPVYPEPPLAAEASRPEPSYSPPPADGMENRREESQEEDEGSPGPPPKPTRRKSP